MDRLGLLREAGTELVSNVYVAAQAREFERRKEAQEKDVSIGAVMGVLNGGVPDKNWGKDTKLLYRQVKNLYLDGNQVLRR